MPESMPSTADDSGYKHFVHLLNEDKQKSPAVACVETLYRLVCQSTGVLALITRTLLSIAHLASTVQGLTDELHVCVRAIRASDAYGTSCTSVSSAAELFMRFISLAALDQPDFAECRRVLVMRGEQFIDRVGSSRAKIVQLAQAFINDGAVILTHSYSRCVCSALLAAASAGKRLTVYVCESRPDGTGTQLRHQLAKAGVACTVILDAAVGYVMPRVDFVLLGAEGVVETGGILNKIGSLTVGICARAMNKPVYVLAESVKFIKLYPLSQNDVPDEFKYSSSVLRAGDNLRDEHPLVDYTPPEYIKLLFTDLGILTPAAVSDELIKLYL